MSGAIERARAILPQAAGLVGPPRAARLLAIVLGLVVLALPVALVAIPWQQNVPASGRVTALDPLDRVQLIRAPVTGRLVELNVREGVWVEGGALLARMADQDPQYALRLEQQLQLARDKAAASEDMVELLRLQRQAAESARDQAVASAESRLLVAVEGIKVAESELEGLEAQLEQKREDFDRKRRTFEVGAASELEFQVAERDYRGAQAKVEAARAQVELARNRERAQRADVENVRNEAQASIEKIGSEIEKARSESALAQKELIQAATALDRQSTQVITAPRSGYVQRVHAASTADFLTQGSPLIELVPDSGQLAVELWVRGIDAPLVTPGRSVRLQFEGWPAVQFVAGWPSAAVGTFGGVVQSIDAHGRGDGRFRVMVVPDPDDQPWPERARLRQGVRTSGWLLLDTVSLGRELWRVLNAFPPSVAEQAPDGGAAPGVPSGEGQGGKQP